MKARKLHSDLLESKLRKIVHDAKELESKLWTFLHEKHSVKKMLADLRGLILLAQFELRKIEEFEHSLVRIEKTQAAKEVENDLLALENLIDSQLRKLEGEDALSQDKIVEILDGDKRDGRFSESSQAIQRIISHLEKDI